MPDFSIEHATLDDIERLASLWAALDANAPMPKPFGGAGDSKTQRTRLTIKHAIESTDAVMLVATETTASGREIHGTIAGHVFNNTAVKLSPMGVIYSLWVEPEYRGHGLGHRLLLAVETELKDKGAKSLQVGWDSRDPIIDHWWRSHHYAPYETIASKDL